MSALVSFLFVSGFALVTLYNPHKRFVNSLQHGNASAEQRNWCVKLRKQLLNVLFGENKGIFVRQTLQRGFNENSIGLRTKIRTGIAPTCFGQVAYPGIFFGGGSTNSVEDKGEREWGSGGGSPLVRGSGGSCNLVQEISFHMVKFS